MKKIVMIAAALLITASTGLSAPVNDLDKGQTAAGIGSNNTFYLEHKLAENFTLGLQNVNWDHRNNMDNVYGQLQLANNFRGILGSNDVNSNAKVYVGMAINGPLAPEWEGYTSLIAGKEFKELQVGANFKITYNADINFTYHTYMPDEGENKSGVGIGATLKF
ncbi:hypothetical protein [Pelosinus propionicus]|uniref:Outer membrane protein beta-barrel domain-containing protein n=1 Tax=Pelosinus propionicus DSM 13327 TaxID=1123291 RepID=A0A1I4PSE0_9FIRM|nr:hypothetical protein [Pelosinus propionicus]SFM30440.1 hypothetical protein SAMN04490355_107110 [Pelosinus propionicus DSM 13327]